MRRTLASPTPIGGVGLHTGRAVEVVCRDAPSGNGIAFRRIDLPGAPVIPATLASVSGSDRSTTLGPEGASVTTVEHLLAAASALELDDLLIEVDGPELPIGDGSFRPFFDPLRSAGIREQSGSPRVFRIASTVTCTEGAAEYRAEPAPELRITAAIEWDHPAIGRQQATFRVRGDDFARELAGARTFGFAAEAEELRSRGLARGGGTDTAVVLDDRGPIGTTLRWPDEFVRHKAGDLIGDLALLGGRLEAHITAIRPGHQGNLALARRLAAAASEGESLMDIRRILEVIPHRYPFLMVDRIVEVDGNRIVGIKNVTINEPFFQGHFPGHPIMPGVLIVEAMAQVGGMLLLGQIERPEDKVVYFMSLDNVKFRRPVVPGDQLRCELEMLQNRGRTCRMKGVAYVDGQVVAEAEMMARVVDR